MTDSTFPQSQPHRGLFATVQTRWPVLWTALLAGCVALCLVVLEARFWGIETTQMRVGATPVTLYRAEGAAQAPLVIVAHGFGGSRQMMDQIAVTLARQGFLAASIDLPGHGRNGRAMSPDVTSLDGTTAQLAAVVVDVAEALTARPEAFGPVSFVGHSMASDIVIRAAQAMPEVGGVVAISMYSPAVTASSPQNLLVLSGAFEGHLREAGLAAVHQIDPLAAENETVTAGGLQRRTAVAPFVGHVGVLYSGTSLDEVGRWLQAATGAGDGGATDRTGWVAGVLLLALVALVWPLAAWVPTRAKVPVTVVPKRVFVACVVLPIPAAMGMTLLPPMGLAGHAAFGTLALILGASGLLQLTLLYRAGLRPRAPDGLGLLVYLGMALVFALALDRYGAAFLPTGERWLVALGLLLGTVPVMLAETMLTHRAPILRRLLVRLSLLVAIAAAMALAPMQLGLSFTVLPVLVLFFLVYGTMARYIAQRRGPEGVALGKAIVLAWAIAASTPLFAVAGAS